ncbi:MAG: hypothetical protein JOS17DRAFT_833470 [Linnemannia elongata]|nr:MAG: hypothetical protein JOS17DRAFT_833470 [Linnemannia elongata]
MVPIPILWSLAKSHAYDDRQYLSLHFVPHYQTAMSHQRSQSTSSILNEHNNPSSYTNNNTTKTAPLSISLPRQRSMSTSFGFSGPTPSSSSAAPTSPVATFSASSSINPNPFLNPIISPSSGSSSGGGGGSGSNATPSSTLASLSSSIPSSLNRRFSANFTNPLTTTANMATSPTSIDDRGRRPSLFGSSPPLSRHHTDIHEPTFTTNTTMHPHDSTDTGGGGGGGIGGLFRKFSVSGRSGMHQLDRNEPGPASSHDILNTHQGPPAPKAHIKAVDALKPPPQKDQISRSSSPMRSMILNGQMLD